MTYKKITIALLIVIGLTAILLCVFVFRSSNDSPSRDDVTADAAVADSVKKDGAPVVSPEPSSEDPVVTGPAVDPEPTATPEVSLKKLYKNTPATTIIDVEGQTKKELKKLFYVRKIDDKTFASMQGKSYPSNCIIPRSALRRVRILYLGFDQETHIGELIVNVSRAEEFRYVFQKLYFKKYELEKVQPIDAYGGSDRKSMKDNNTSCFNFRVVAGTTHLSNHAYGVAVDVNPKINPYIWWSGGKLKVSPKNGAPYADRTKDFPHKITHTDLCYKLFHNLGYTWGGDWTSSKDYQHFQKK